MLEDSITSITEQANGANLTFLCGLEKWARLCIDESVDSIIDQVKQGYTRLVSQPLIASTTSLSSKNDG